MTITDLSQTAGEIDLKVANERLLTARACFGSLAPLALRLHTVIDTPDGPGTLVQLFHGRAAVSRPTQVTRVVGGDPKTHKGGKRVRVVEGKLRFYDPRTLRSYLAHPHNPIAPHGEPRETA